MADLWGLGEGAVPHQANWQVRGRPNPDQQALIDSGVYIEQMWYGPTQQEPYRSGFLEDQLSVMDRINAFLPELTAIRMPFNINHWGTYGSAYDNGGEAMRDSTTFFLQAMAERGIKIHWCLMDGPSQRDGVEVPHPTVHTEASWLAWASQVNARQILSHRRLMDWCEANPGLAPVPWAHEAINEPDSYAVMGSRLRNMPLAYATYAQHNINIFREVYDRPESIYKDAWFFVGGFNYSANFDALARPNSFVPGGISPLQHIRNNIDPDRLCWSMHAYPGWIGGTDRHESRRAFRRRMGGKVEVGGIEGDRIIITEINGRHDALYNYPIISDQFWGMNVNENAQWFAELGMGYGWWTLGNYAQARLIQIQGGLAGVRHDTGYSYALYHNVASQRNNPLYCLSQQFGEIPLTVDQNIQRWTSTSLGSDEREELAAAGLIGSQAQILGIGRQTRGHGGRGTCILRGIEGAANMLYGGDGWNVAYGGTATPCLDYLVLGRGGGVLRTPHSVRAILYGSTHSYGRVYAGPGKNSVILFDNTTNPTDIVFDPTSPFSSSVLGFNPNRDGQGGGDRFSFRGAFADPQALRDAMSIQSPPHTAPGTQVLGPDIVVNLPSGGKVWFSNASNLLAIFPTLCRDFEDGWYAEGWSEPADYDPDELDGPAPSPEELYFDPLLFDEEAVGGGGGGGDEGDLGVPVRTSGGVAVIRGYDRLPIPIRND